MAGSTNDKTIYEFSHFFGNNYPDLSTTGILSHNTKSAVALDKNTEVNSVSISGPPSIANEWTFGDIQLAYDPCVCNYFSRLNIQPYTYDEAKIFMEGRLIGTEVPLDNSGNSPLLNGENFLSSITQAFEGDSFIVNDGRMTYNNIQDLVDKHQIDPHIAFVLKMIDVVKPFTSFIPKIKGTESIFEISQYISLLPPSVASEVLPIWQQVDQTKYEIPVGSILSNGFSFLTKALSNDVPRIGFIEGELLLQGTIQNQSPSQGMNSFSLFVPGSKNSHIPQVLWTDYPLYNEAVGIFALLETPKLYYDKSIRCEDNPYNPFGCATGFRDLGFRFGLVNNPIKYTLNPAAEINVENTEIYASIEFDVVSDNDNIITIEDFNSDGGYTSIYRDEASNISTHLLRDFAKPVFFLVNEKVVNGKRIETYQTYVVPIDKLGTDFTCYSMDFDNALNSNLVVQDFRLKVFANYEFLPNNYGEVNQVEQVYTYKLDNNYDGVRDLSTALPSNGINFDPDVGSTCLLSGYQVHEILNAPQTITLNSQNFSSSQDIFAQNIIIDGDITTTNNAIVNIYAANEINFVNGSISPEINLEIKDFFEHEELNPVSDLFVKNFCNSNTYKAKQPSAKVLLAAQNDFYVEKANSEEVDKNPLHANYKLYPNPTQGNLRFDLQTEFDANISVAMYDLSGREVRKYTTNENWQKGKHQKEYDISNLSDGVYLFKFCINENCFNEKVVKAE